MPHNPIPTFWPGRRVLLTGHTGFKGAWLALWLMRRGAHVTGIALPPATSPALFDLLGLHHDMASHICDIRDAQALTTLIRQTRPEIVFHLAAQPLVRASYREPASTFATNVLGTVHVLEALRGLDSIRVAMMITTDKVYQNREWPWPYREGDALGGHDPYSASKAAAEIAIASYRDAFLAEQGVAVASLRAGNVIGGGDWSEDRLFPDMIRAWQAGKMLTIRRPHAIRPWQHVLEPISAYLRIAETLWNQPHLASAYNIGPLTHEAATVQQVVEIARNTISCEVRYGDETQGPHEAGWLALETAKVRTIFGLTPKWDLAQTIQRTISWYQAQHQGADACALCESDISLYETIS